MYSKNILILGCGNIGSRHLQALTKLPYNLEIDIIEPNSDSKDIAKSRLNQSNFDSKKHKISWFDTVDESLQSYDLAIISTPSPRRVENIIKLLEMGIKQFLIEKIVCQSDAEYESLLSNLEKYDAKGWINTNMRYFDFYQKIKTNLKKSKIHISVIGSRPVLGTNAIHYLDLACWLSDDPNYVLSGDYLMEETFPNKRGTQFLEFAGTLIGTGKKSSAVLTFFPESDLPTIISIVDDENHIMIDEMNDKIFVLSGNLEINYQFEHVSTLTTKIIYDIFEKNDCLLPTAAEIFPLHSELFRIFNNHLKKTKNIETSLCPIT